MAHQRQGWRPTGENTEIEKAFTFATLNLELLSDQSITSLFSRRGKRNENKIQLNNSHNLSRTQMIKTFFV
jgi:hypothetical protein